MIWGPIGAIGGWGIGHPMSPFELKVSDRVDGVLATIHSTLSLGLGYVSSTPGLMAWWWWDREREMWFDVDLWIGGSSNLEVSWCLGPRCGLFPVEEDAEALHPDWPFGVLQHLKGGISMQHQSASVSCLPFVTQESSSNLPDSWHSWIVSVQLCRCMPSRTWICVEDQFGGFLRWK